MKGMVINNDRPSSFVMLIKALERGRSQITSRAKEGVSSSVTECDKGDGESVRLLPRTHKFYLLTYIQFFTTLNNLSSCEYSATQYFGGNESHPDPRGIGKKAFLC